MGRRHRFLGRLFVLFIPFQQMSRPTAPLFLFSNSLVTFRFRKPLSDVNVQGSNNDSNNDSACDVNDPSAIIAISGRGAFALLCVRLITTVRASGSFGCTPAVTPSHSLAPPSQRIWDRTSKIEAAWAVYAQHLPVKGSINQLSVRRRKLLPGYASVVDHPSVDPSLCGSIPYKCRA